MASHYKKKKTVVKRFINKIFLDVRLETAIMTGAEKIFVSEARTIEGSIF